MNALKLLLILLAAAIPFVANAQQSPEELQNVDLLQLQRQETAGLSGAQVREMNLQAIRNLPSQKPFEAVFKASFPALIRSQKQHPIIGDEVAEDYSQPTSSIGYCFGRAYYFHRALNMLGVTDNAIMKAWVVGKIGKNWAFHVATIVRAEDGQWYALDTLASEWSRGVPVKDWYDSWISESSETTRIYFTVANKFTASLGAYDGTQLGYGLDRQKDWYKNYFLDLDFWFDSRGSMPYFRQMGLH